ncbi:hypothetical protein [Streptomyces sp. JJ36]|uniref:DUF7144 family membrane protein n=1 Tax=Streptomyces sp. JJ36 TaxID=2736645 RepID=UPI001F3B500B|nr:hypothetical protein [Streptomyces sp. JJ36]MCF6522997.1 hypothetical protein [Streptomyces sp. JJ36]
MTTTARGGPSALAGGVVAFAGVMMLITGVLDVFRGIAALGEDQLVVSSADYTFEFDVTGWGWIHLILGAVTVLAGLGLFSGAIWARAFAVLMASLIIVANFLSLPYYPVWSVVVIAMAALVIWAVFRDRPGFG